MADWDFYTVVDGYVGPLAVDAAAKEATDVATGQTLATSPGASQIPERPEELRWEVQAMPCWVVGAADLILGALLG